MYKLILMKTMVLLLVLLNCSLRSQAQSEYLSNFAAVKNEVAAVKQEHLAAYWQAIYDVDQANRGCQTNVRLDLQNALKVHYLIERFGYPRDAQFSSDIAFTPWLVYAHQPYANDRPSTKRLLYAHLIAGYKQGELDLEWMRHVHRYMPCAAVAPFNRPYQDASAAELLELMARCEPQYALPSTTVDTIERYVVQIYQYWLNDTDFLTEGNKVAEWQDEFHTRYIIEYKGAFYFTSNAIKQCPHQKNNYRLLRRERIDGGFKFTYPDFYSGSYYLVRDDRKLIYYNGFRDEKTGFWNEVK